MAVQLSIKCEIDSRVFLYPLMQCLLPLGNCLLVTSNKQVTRLIDNEFDGYFRNFHILYDTEGATDETLEAAGVSVDEYAYVVYDNVAVVGQDKLYVLVGPILSESFEADLTYLGKDDNTFLVKYGAGKGPKPKTKPVKAPKMTDEEMFGIDPTLPVKERKKLIKEARAEKIRQDAEEAKARKEAAKNKGHKYTEDELEEMTKAKFKPKVQDVKAKLAKTPVMSFPTYAALENFESTKIFATLDRKFPQYIYVTLQEYIGLSETNYVCSVHAADTKTITTEQEGMVRNLKTNLKGGMLEHESRSNFRKK